MKELLIAAALVILLSLAGCGPGGLFLPNIKDYSPEQLEAMKDLGYDPIRCAHVSGPPPQGIVTTVTVPKNRPAKVLFRGCVVESIEVGNPATPEK